MTINSAALYSLSRQGHAQLAAPRLTYWLLLPTLLLLTSLAFAADVSGKWNGSLEFKVGDSQTQTAAAHAELKQEGNTITGKVWKEEGQQFAIEQGHVTGNEISFQFRAPEGEDEQTLVHSVKLTFISATQLQGTLEFESGGQKLTGKLTFSRE